MKNHFWREATVADSAGIVEMYAAEKRHNPRLQIPDLASIEHTLKRVISTPQAVGTIVVNESNDVIGVAFVMLFPVENETTGQCFGHVHIGYRAQGIGTALFKWMEQMAQRQNTELAADQPLHLRISCRDFMTDRIALFESQGFAPVRHAIEMQRSLDQPIQAIELPAELIVKQWSESQDDQLRLAFNLAFKDHWGLREFETDDWRKRFIETPHFRPDLTYLAYSDEQLIAFCLVEHHAERNKQSGQNQVWLEAIGVLPDWRGRGIASGLVTYAMQNYQTEGFSHAGLDVDAENGTNAIALYQKLGFAEVQHEIIYGKCVL
ncbi:MAG: GNAT family N-acetyltransferase [Anaerolineae bacterium]